MRRSRRYRDKKIFHLDLETRSIGQHARLFTGPNTEAPTPVLTPGVMTAYEQRKRAKHGWRNWHINRGRLPLEGNDRVERQLSWRRVH